MDLGTMFQSIAPIALLSGAFGATLGALLTGFFTQRGKDIATRQNFDELQKQLSANTETVKGIEGRLLRIDWLGREEFQYRRQQLSEFYGPLYGLLKTTQDIYHLWRSGKMQTMNLPVKKLLEQQNNLTIALVRSKVHLLDEGQMPDCLVRLITSALVWNLYCPISNDAELPRDLAEHERVKYPTEVITYVVEKTEKLKKRCDELLQEAAFKTTVASCVSAQSQALGGMWNTKGTAL
jgi:hypothetical protein